MVTLKIPEESEKESVALVGEKVSGVDRFPYLESLIARSGRMDVNVNRGVAYASKTFGALSKAVFWTRT